MGKKSWALAVAAAAAAAAAEVVLSRLSELELELVASAGVSVVGHRFLLLVVFFFFACRKEPFLAFFSASLYSGGEKGVFFASVWSEKR